MWTPLASVMMASVAAQDGTSKISRSSLPPIIFMLCCRPYAQKRSCNVRDPNMPQISDSAVFIRVVTNHWDALGFGHAGLRVCALSQDPDGISRTSSKRQGKDERVPSCSIIADLLLSFCSLSLHPPHHAPSAHPFCTISSSSPTHHTDIIRHL